ncbi:hypothetical protein [Chlorogloea sp. CCALA 695]|uniref:hypothetical protein n=1 Tax=Chlorogloea sp. CCALA 695 TaxID=2107693 RepID=UPI000D048D93|nr:hypothetical protein [Chlorogloea sp. CCALA 695]PSB27941.1 hypothetical protein C7B70_21595 [Chlorogloea sp. CCALA 695]
MQNLLTALIELIFITFVFIMLFDFVSQLLNALNKVKRQAATSQQRSICDYRVEPVSIARLKQPLPLQPATTEWIKQNLSPTEIWAEEIPCAIALAKARLHSFQPQGTPIASKQELINVGIRRCKKLASQLKIRRYNTMRLAELADVLAGKVARAELFV